MPTPKAKVCTVSDRQHQLLEQISRKATNPHRLVERAKLVLLAADGINNTEISNRLEIDVSKNPKILAGNDSRIRGYFSSAFNFDENIGF
ncbi:hypothetical protein NG796_23055 [Laspinema sp. A4]|uniref:hypothetical protein n=1 Tax=Laspinema sp. D2d TaxID=2953686 RepID=UPI0021BAA870|nr:hypothetical protein [Laspinema sp. D2d]MCT7986156.1 hypothetical protein [Laspinema sp. D2d]